MVMVDLSVVILLNYLHYELSCSITKKNRSLTDAVPLLMHYPILINLLRVVSRKPYFVSWIRKFTKNKNIYRIQYINYNKVLQVHLKSTWCFRKINSLFKHEKFDLLLSLLNILPKKK